MNIFFQGFQLNCTTRHAKYIVKLEIYANDRPLTLNSDFLSFKQQRGGRSFVPSNDVLDMKLLYYKMHIIWLVGVFKVLRESSIDSKTLVICTGEIWCDIESLALLIYLCEKCQNSLFMGVRGPHVWLTIFFLTTCSIYQIYKCVVFFISWCCDLHPLWLVELLTWNMIVISNCPVLLCFN